MELVIKISEDSYKATCIGSMLPSDVENVINAIKNGTPLTEGHGDLVDRNDLLAESYVIDDYAGNEINIVDRMTVEMAGAIIEADKAESEGKKIEE